MATGIRITHAYYGVGSNLTDVKSALSSYIRNGELDVVVSADSFGIDQPVPGQPNHLTFKYTINNGSENQKVAYDNEVVRISAPPVVVATGLDITKASYGYPGNMTDVTNAVRAYVQEGSISLKVGYSAVGIPDPNPNKQKVLEVQYTLNGAKNSGSFKDGETFSISAPVAQKTPDGPGAGEVFGKFIMWTLVFGAYFIGIFAAYNYGILFNKWSAYFCAGISLIPVLGFWAVCLFALGYPFYSGTKLNLFQNVVIPFKSTDTITAIATP